MTAIVAQAMDEILRAGAARVELPAEPGWPMMGYGARRGEARERHDALYARALCVERSTDAVLLVECDLCLLSVVQCDLVRAQISRETGLARRVICVACIHTHSGPETGYAARALGQPIPEWEPSLLDAIARAGIDAYASRMPARLGAGMTRARIGRNRRRAGAAIDDRVAVVRIDHIEGGERPERDAAVEAGSALGVLYVHGCHPTALGHDNLAYSADWPGVASETIERALPGAVAIFGLGAHGDVDPRTRGLQDLTVPEQSRGVSFERMAELGREVGDAVVACASRIQTTPDATIGTRVREVVLGVHGAAGGDREGAVEARRRAAWDALGLGPDERVSARELYRLEHERTAHLPRDAQREAIARVRLYLRDRQAPLFAGGVTARVEVQRIVLGPLALEALPLEITADVGLALEEVAGSPWVMPLSIANGWLRYLPHPLHFDAPNAHQQYEVLNSVFPADAARRLLPIEPEGSMPPTGPTAPTRPAGS